MKGADNIKIMHLMSDALQNNNPAKCFELSKTVDEDYLTPSGNQWFVHLLERMNELIQIEEDSNNGC
jgi:hypothetical protein